MTKTRRAVVALALLAAGSRPLAAGPIGIPGASFETPVTNYVNINIDSWQKASKPAWYVEGGGFLWTQLTGTFRNTDPSDADHIDNCDGSQAIWLFAVPEVALFQDYDTVDWNDPAPTHAFDAKFEIGKSYTLTVGIIGGGGGMLEGASMEIGLYYRDGGGNKVAVAATSVVNTLNTFPTNTHLVDFQVRVPVVKPCDPWTGKNLGVRFLSTVPRVTGGEPDLQGGYWDIDNVRLSSVAESPFVVSAARQGGSLRLGWPSATGYQYQVEKSDDLQTWANYESAQPGTGAELLKLYPLAGHANGYFRVKVTAP